MMKRTLVRWFLHGLIGMTLCAGLNLGCRGTVNLIPDGSRIPSEDGVLISAGRGVSFYSLDGESVRAGRLRVLPGERSLRVDVRRALRDLDGEKMPGIYQSGTCRLRIQSLPRERFEVFTRVFAEERFVIVSDEVVSQREQNEGEKLVMGMTVHVKNLDTGQEFRAEPDACDLEIDCSRIDRMRANAGKECTF